MGLCDSSNKRESDNKTTSINENENQLIKKNENQLGRPSTFEGSPTNMSILNEGTGPKKPELDKYKQSLLTSERIPESVTSSSVNETEIICQGNINPKYNSLFESEREVEKNDNDKNNNINQNQKNNSLPDLENISEIKSKKIINPSPENPNIKTNMANNTPPQMGAIINEKYNNQGVFVPYEPLDTRTSSYNSSNLMNIKPNFQKNKFLKNSYKINVSLHESTQKTNAFLNLPKTDQPLPDIEELSSKGIIIDL